MLHPRPPAPPHSSTKDGTSLTQLHDFFLSSCAAYEPSDEPTKRQLPIHLAVSLPPLAQEFSHERALGFAFADEMKVVRQLQLRYRHGEDLFLTIYFTRSCANCLPPPPTVAPDDDDVASVLAYYSGVYEVLRPQVAKLSSLCDFSSQTVGVLCDTIQRISAQENAHRVVPDVLMDSILDVLDLLLRMNHLYDIKGGLRNDFSIFRRAFKHVKGDIADLDSVAKEIQRLHDLIGANAQSKNGVWESLRHNLTSIKRYEQVVILLVKHCIAQHESESKLPPAQRFRTIRVLPALISLLQGDPIRNISFNLSNTEKKLVDTAISIINRYPALPIFADLSLNPVAMLCDFSSQPFPHTFPMDSKSSDSYDFVRVVRRARRGCTDYTPRLMGTVNAVIKASFSSLSEAVLASTTSLVWEGLQLLFNWKSSLQLFLALKFQRPKTNEELQQLGISLEHPVAAYRAAMTSNVSVAEREALLELIHMIKSLAGLIRKHQAYLTPCLRAHISSQLQAFVQHTLVPLMHRADKKKHASVKSLQDVRLTCGNWIRDESPMGDYMKRRKDRQLPDLTKTKLKAPPTLSQLQMLRTVVNAIYAKRSRGELESKMSMFSFQRELKSSDVETLQRFYSDSASYHLLLDFETVARDLSNLDELVFREMFLEVMKTPSLPVEDSLPWFILEHAMAGARSPLTISSIFSLLDVYNDAIRCSLIRTGRAPQCDEVSAEAKLFFDHFVYLLADHVYESAKSDAARVVIGRERLLQLKHQAAWQDLGGIASSERLFQAIGRLRRVTVVDEVCDVSLLVSGYLIDRFMRDLRSTVGKMARHDATIFVAIADLLSMMRQTHARLSEWFIVDDFEALWQEATSERSNIDGEAKVEGSRVQRVAKASIFHDLLVNFAYNTRTRRFFRTPLAAELRPLVATRRSVDTFSLAVSKDSATTSSRKLLDCVGLDRDCRVGFDLLHQPYRSFVGIPHIEAMMSLLSPAEVVETVEDLIELISTQIEDVMHLFLPVLGSAIPPYRLPKLLYRAEGCFGYFYSKFKHVMDSKELEAHFFHCLRIIGNALAVIQMMSQVECSRASTHKAGRDVPLSRSLFTIALQRVYDFLDDTDLLKQWSASLESNPETGDKNSSTFFLVWVAIEYLACCSSKENGSTCYRELYGEGVQFTGSVFIHLLHQRTLYEQWNPSQYVLDVHSHDTIKQSAMKAIAHGSRGKKNAGTSTTTAPQVGLLDSEMVDAMCFFVAHATQMRMTMAHFFSLLEATWSPAGPSERRVEFSPPQ